MYRHPWNTCSYCDTGRLTSTPAGHYYKHDPYPFPPEVYLEIPPVTKTNSNTTKVVSVITLVVLVILIYIGTL